MHWSSIKGHDATREAFERIVSSNRLAHAYLFTGPQGIGKRLFAIELARTLLCEKRDPDTLAPCGDCPSCHQVEAGTHPDFILAKRPEEALEFPVSLMREVCQRFTIKSARGHGKVAIVDDADDLNPESANSFLKTLEEPPPRSVIILISASSDRQLATIVSRCQVIRFAPLSDETVAEVLREQGVDANLIPRLLSMAEGSPGQALALADEALWDFRQRWIQGLASPKLQTVTLSKEWVRFVEDAGKESSLRRRRASQCISLLLAFLRQALHVALGNSPEQTDPVEKKAVTAFAARVDVSSLMELIDRCLASDAQIDRRVQLELILEALMDAMGQRLNVG